MKKFYVVNIKAHKADMLEQYIHLENRKSNKYLYLIKSTFLDNRGIEPLYEKPHLHERFLKKDMICCDENRNYMYKAFETEKEALEFIELKKLNLKLTNFILNNLNMTRDEKILITDLEVLKDFVQKVVTE